MSQLLPDGIRHLGDAPYTLHRAITQALRILDYEEFPIEERPPRRIWMDNDRLTDWWRDVERQRKEKWNSPTSSSETLDDDEDGPTVQHNAVELIVR